MMEGFVPWFVALSVTVVAATPGHTPTMIDGSTTKDHRPSTTDYRLSQHSLDEVAAGLKARDVATRLRAIKILRDAGYPEAAGPLAVALSDPDDRVTLEAIDAERSLFVLRPVEQRRKVGLVVEVRAQNAGSGTFAAEKLALLPLVVPPQVLSGLAGGMRSSNPRVRLAALSVFGTLAPLGGHEAEAAVRTGIGWTIEALKRGNRVEQVAAAETAARALAECGAAMRPSSDPANSLCADTGNALLDAVNSRDPQVRRAAMTALGELRYPNAAQALSDQLSFYQRGADAQAALAGLAGIGHPTSVDIFKRALASPDTDMRRLAVEGIGRSGSAADLPDLERLGESERAGPVLLAIHFALLKLGSPIKPDQLVVALKNAALRPLALEYLLELSPALSSRLAEELRNQDPPTRMFIADILGFSHNAKVVPALEAAAKDLDPEAARAATRAIDRIKLGS
jgi:HEAT repeat protein